MSLYQHLVSSHSFAISPRVSREFCLKFLPLRDQRAQGKPGAQCTRSLARRNEKNARVVTQVHRNIPAFPAQWFTAYNALSPVTGFLATVACVSYRRLDPASGSQDHTPSPSAG
jgi:hypothetical protein